MVIIYRCPIRPECDKFKCPKCGDLSFRYQDTKYEIKKDKNHAS